MRTLGALLVLAVIIAGAFWLVNRGDVDLARDELNATTTENMTGTGGPDEGYDPLEDADDDNVDSKG